MKVRTVVAIIGLSIVGNLICSSSWARERARSGSYKGKRGNTGTFQRQTDLSRGQSERSTTWQNERGEGRRQASSEWDQDSGKGSYSSSTTTADGKTSSRQGQVIRNEDGSFSQSGTYAGPKGKTSAVERNSVKNDDGSRSVKTTYTGENGQAVTTEKTITRDEGTRQVDGRYETGSGKRGSFSADSQLQDGKIVTDRAVTNQDNKTWRQHAEVGREANTVTREVANSDPSGQSHSFSQSVTIDTDTAGGKSAP